MDATKSHGFSPGKNCVFAGFSMIFLEEMVVLVEFPSLIPLFYDRLMTSMVQAAFPGWQVEALSH